MSSWLNLSGTINAFRVLREPSICLPHATVPTFAHLPIPISKAFVPREKSQGVDIQAVVLDKDNCFAVPHENEVYAPFNDKFAELRKAYPGSKLLIVSNTSGTSSDADGKDAELLEKNTGVMVLRHDTKKPGCHDEIMTHFRSKKDSGVTSPHQVAIIGDRLFTDMMLANMMGSYGIWTRQGVPGTKPGLFARLEFRLADFLTKRGYVPPDPRSSFE